MNFVQITDFDWWHATFTVFWLNIAFIAVHSGKRCGPWPLVVHLVVVQAACIKISTMCSFNSKKKVKLSLARLFAIHIVRQQTKRVV